jgi:hypothetical protein
MSLSFSGSKVTHVRPVAFQIDNFGPEVKAVTFSYNGVVHTINRRGKVNIKGFTSFKEHTYSLTNGTDKYLRMSRSGFQFVSVVYTDGTVESNEWIPNE